MTVDGILIPLVSIGSIVTPHLSFPNVYLLLKLTLNLASIGQLYDSSDYLVIFSFFLLCTGSAVLKVDWDRSLEEGTIYFE
jgi:hypothetical protein